MVQPDATPTAKVTAGAIGGAVAVILIAILNSYTSFQTTPEVASALTVLFSSLAAYYKEESD